MILEYITIDSDSPSKMKLKHLKCPLQSNCGGKSKPLLLHYFRQPKAKQNTENTLGINFSKKEVVFVSSPYEDDAVSDVCFLY